MTDQITREEYNQLSAAEKTQARRDGRLTDILAGRTPSPPAEEDVSPAPAAPSIDGAGRTGIAITNPVGPGQRQLTLEEYRALPAHQRREARSNGLLNQLLGINN